MPKKKDDPVRRQICESSHPVRVILALWDWDGSYPLSFTLNVMNTVEPQQVETFTVSTTAGHTLLQALQAYHKSRPGEFSFQTGDAPTSGPYLAEVQVVGKRTGSGKGKFWETLLYDDGEGEVKPISLCYKVCEFDNVFLRFSHF